MKKSSIAIRDQRRSSDDTAGFAEPSRGNAARAGSRVPAVILAAAVGLAVLVLAGAGAFYLVAIRPATSLPARLSQAFARLTGAEVTLSGNSVEISRKDISELAVVERRMQSIVKYESSLLGSDNVLILRGDFVVKAGYDLKKPHAISFDPSDSSVTVDFPPAEILSVELKDYEVFHSEDGFWNKVTPSVQESATREMLAQARLDAQQSDIRAEAEDKLLSRLQDLLGGTARELRINAREVPLP